MEEDVQQGYRRLIQGMRALAPGHVPNDRVGLEQEGQVVQNQLRKAQRTYRLQCEQRHAHLRLCVHVLVSTMLQMDVAPVLCTQEVVDAQRLQAVE